MIKYKSHYDEEGIVLLPNRFRCCLSKDDRVFKTGLNYPHLLKIGTIISLTFFVLFFQFFKRKAEKLQVTRTIRLVLDVVDVPQTAQVQRTAAPTRPSVPIVSEDEEIPEDETIDFTDLDLEAVPPPPPPPPPEVDEDTPIFVPFDEPPSPVGGFAAIQENLVYPDIGRKAGIQGVVVLHLRIDENGNITNVKVAKSLDIEAFDTAAENAVRAVKWNPAKQRDMPIAVWYSVALQFRLN